MLVRLVYIYKTNSFSTIKRERERERERALNMYSNCFLMAICLIINKDGFVAHVLHISLVATLRKYYLITTLKCNIILKIWQRLGLNASMY